MLNDMLTLMVENNSYKVCQCVCLGMLQSTAAKQHRIENCIKSALARWASH